MTDYRPVSPVPPDAPAPDWDKLRPQEAIGDPVKISTYPTAEGGVAFYVARWLPKDPDDDKVIRPATWDGSKWRLKGMPAPRPLYRLPDIPKSAGPVVVVEGEKCADGAHDAFAFQLVTTWSGGCRALNRTNWQPLAGREVLLVADADDPGRKAMEALAQHLHSLGCKVRIYLPEGDDGKDIFDWIEADGADDVRERIEAGAKQWTPMDWKDELAERAKSDPGAPFEPDMPARLAELRRDNAAEWQRLLRKLREAKVMIGDLKAAMAATESRDSDGLQGQPLQWDEVEPWPGPVDGAALLDAIAELIRRYVDMPETSADAAALWVVHTWMHDRLKISTFLNITSATKRCGKSLLMEVLVALVCKPLAASGRITPAALFRTIELYAPTLLLDEADTFLGDDKELRGLVNGSQRRDLAYVMRTVGDDYEPRLFGIWCAKVISGIGSLHDTVLDRSLLIRLERRAPNVGDLPRWRDRDEQAIADLNCKLARWIADDGDAVLERRNDVAFPLVLNDRTRDAWEALLAIGEVAGGEWAGGTGRAYRACEAINASAESETGAREMLLADLWQVFRGAGDPAHLPTGKPDVAQISLEPAILPALVTMEDRPWSEWSRGKPLSPRGLATLLKSFGIAPSTIRVNGGATPKGYKRAAFEPVWKRYDIPSSEDPPKPSATTPQLKVSAGFGDSVSATSPDRVADGKSLNSAVGNGCGVVAATNPPSTGNGASDDVEKRAEVMENGGGLSSEEVKPLVVPDTDDLPTNL